jgi:hypothetical protein
MNEEVLRWLQGISALAASFGGLVVAFMALYQWRQTTRWRQGEEGRKLVDDLFLSDKHGGTDALLMTELPEGKKWTFEDKSNSKIKTHEVNRKDVIEALDGSADTDKTAFIRGCFDDLFYYLERIDLFLEKGFITYEDVCSPLAFYEEQMAEVAECYKVYKEYIKRIRAGRAVRFLKRLEEVRTKRKVIPDTP